MKRCEGTVSRSLRFFYFYVFCSLRNEEQSLWGKEEHYPEEGVPQQTTLCTSRSWHLDSVRAGRAGWPLLSPKQAGSSQGRSFEGVVLLPLHWHYRQLRVMLFTCMCRKNMPGDGGEMPRRCQRCQGDAEVKLYHDKGWLH